MNKEVIKNNFQKAIDTYNKQATVQKTIAFTLADMIDIKQANTVTELGCGTGMLTELVKKKILYKQYYANDLFESPHVNLCGDMEKIDIPKSDLIVSASAFQWVQDLNKLFKKIYKRLKEGGEFTFSMFIEGNLYETNQIINGLKYYSKQEIEQMLFNIGFEVIEHAQEDYVKNFSSLREMFDEFKNTGVILNEQASHSELRNFDFTKLTYKSAFFVCKKI